MDNVAKIATIKPNCNALVDAIYENSVNVLKWRPVYAHNKKNCSILSTGPLIKKTPLSRYIMFLSGSSPAPSDRPLCVHLNRDFLDNRRSNLIWASKREVSVFHAKPPKNNTSGYRGVFYNKEKARWTARYNKKFIGNFESAKEAAIAWNKALMNDNTIRDIFKVYNDVLLGANQ